jgi:V-type H+-transporting ATPase subunit H
MIITNLSTATDKMPIEATRSTIDWLQKSFKSNDKNVVTLSTQLLQLLLRVDGFRLEFSKTALAIGALIGTLKKSPTPQIQYQVIFSVWLLSFLPDVSKELQR